MKVELTKGLSNKFANMAILCAFFVVVIHCRPHFAEGCFAWWVQQLLENGVCLIAVPFFFVSSGFFLAGHVDETGWWRSAVRKRMVSLFIPYLIWNTLFLCFSYLIGLISTCLSVKEFLAAFGLNPTWYPILTPLWYVRGLIVLVFLSPLLIPLSKRKWALVLLFLVYGTICPGPRGEGALHELTRCGVLPLAGFFYFSFGIAIRLGTVRIPRDLRLSLIMFGMGVALFVLQGILILRGFVNAQLLGWLAIPLALAGVWGMMSESSGPKWLAASAFPVYLVHKFFYPLAHHLFDGLNGVVGYALAFCFVFAASIGVVFVLRKTLPAVCRIAFGGR